MCKMVLAWHGCLSRMGKREGEMSVNWCHQGKTHKIHVSDVVLCQLIPTSGVFLHALLLKM